MGKPKLMRNEVNTRLCAGAEGFQRLNFLYQASLLVSKAVPCCPALSSYYGSHIVGIGRKLLLKMDPSVKRTMCKRCKALMLPGMTAKVAIWNKTLKTQKTKKVSSKLCKVQKWVCTQCRGVRDFSLKSDDCVLPLGGE